MKILFLLDEMKVTCGVTSHLLNLCYGLKQNNVEVNIICGEGSNFESFSNLKIPITIIKEFAHNHRNHLRYLFAHIKLFFNIINNGFDLIHSHHHYCANIAFNISKMFKIKTVQTNHGILPCVGRLRHFRADYYIAISNHTFDYMTNVEKIRRDRLSLIMNGVCVDDRIKIRSRSKIKFITACRLVHDKGVQDYIRAIHVLEEKHSNNAEFYIAGDGEFNSQLMSLNSKLGGKGKFLGEVKNLFAKLYDYDVFVMTSCSKSEGFPMTLIEATLTGCIIVTSRFWGLDKIFCNENGCFTYDPGDYKSLASVMDYIIQSFDEIITTENKLLRLAKHNFSGKKMTNDTLKFYSEILSAK